MHLKPPYLENYLHLSICMLLRAMCSHWVLLARFYPHCEFETSNLHNELNLSIVMLFRAICSHIELLTQFYSDSVFETPQSRELPLFNDIHAPQRNVFTLCASGAILFALCIWNPNLYNYFYVSIFMLLRAICSHIELLTRFYSHCAFKSLYQEN